MVAEAAYHGGNIEAARRRFPNAPEPWIDLSTGINPHPYPVGEVASTAWTRLPESGAVTALELAARHAYGSPSTADLVAAPGTQALIQILPQLLPARRVGILGFTYREYERCWSGAGAEVTIVETLSELASFDVGIVVNPNNPDGRRYPPEAILSVAAALTRHKGLLLVDEAFMDVYDKTSSVLNYMKGSKIIVLRSVGKAYGLAGLRLGFAITPPDLGHALRDRLGPWAVSGPAIEIGRRALSDADWLQQARARLAVDSSRLDALLLSSGFAIVGGTPLFRLAEHKEAAGWFDHLGRRGILVRPFTERPEWLRFGIPGDITAWSRLETALSQNITS